MKTRRAADEISAVKYSNWHFCLYCLDEYHPSGSRRSSGRGPPAWREVQRISTAHDAAAEALGRAAEGDVARHRCAGLASDGRGVARLYGRGADPVGRTAAGDARPPAAAGVDEVDRAECVTVAAVPFKPSSACRA